MRRKDNAQPKTLGPRAAEFVAAVYDRGRAVFTLADVVEITGLMESSARSFVRKLVDRGVATRLKPGVYVLVPFELGREREYLGNPYVVAHRLMAGKVHYISHASAMDIHGMVTQPQLVVFVTSPAAMRRLTVLGTEFRFVRCKPTHVFGVDEHWVDKREKVPVSDLERTVIDGLKHPEYCGGVAEVAKGIWMRRRDVRAEVLAEYALRLGVGAVIRRVGYLMELYGVGGPEEIARLREKLTATYSLLDPVLPPEGTFLARWRLRLNVAPEELQAIMRT